jgi:type I restriction-modification system DNA methylase subunit
MDADDFRDNMLSFLFLRYLSNNWFPIRRVCSKAQQQ